jgi:hypothetical protein
MMDLDLSQAINWPENVRYKPEANNLPNYQIPAQTFVGLYPSHVARMASARALVHTRRLELWLILKSSG